MDKALNGEKERKQIMQDLSFSFPTPHFQLGGFEFSVLIYTFRNVYAPDEAQMTVEQPGDTLWAESRGLRWAGGQMEMPGRFEVRARICSNGIRVKTTAEIQLSLIHISEPTRH